MKVLRFPTERVRKGSSLQSVEDGSNVIELVQKPLVKTRSKYMFDIVLLVGPVSKDHMIESFKKANTDISQVTYFSDVRKNRPTSKEQLLIIDDICSLTLKEQANLVDVLDSDKSPTVVVMAPSKLVSAQAEIIDPELLKLLLDGEIDMKLDTYLSLTERIESVLYGPVGALMF